MAGWGAGASGGAAEAGRGAGGARRGACGRWVVGLTQIVYIGWGRGASWGGERAEGREVRVGGGGWEALLGVGFNGWLGCTWGGWVARKTPHRIPAGTPESASPLGEGEELRPLGLLMPRVVGALG